MKTLSVLMRSNIVKKNVYKITKYSKLNILQYKP